MVEFALAWYLTLKTGSATVLATAMLIAFLPPIVLGPVIGPYIDRWNRKRIMILADLAIALMTVGLVVLFYLDAVQVWHIYLALIVRSAGQSIHFPAMQAAIPMIVPEKQLSRAAGLTQMLQGIISIAGPPAGALLLGLFPMEVVLEVDIVTAIIAVGCLLPIFIPQPVRSVSTAKNNVAAEIIAGFRYIWAWRGLRVLMVLSGIIGFFLMPAFTLLPILVSRFLGGEVLRLGWLESAFGIGMIAGGLALGAWGGFKRKLYTCLAGVILAGLSTIGLGFTSFDLFYLGVASSLLVGLGLTFANGPIMATLQSVVARDMQGRVFSLLGSLSSVITPLGLAMAGPTADAIGIRTLYFIAGSAIVFVGIASFFIPALLDLEKTARQPDTY